jgi:hypothetical protein
MAVVSGAAGAALAVSVLAVSVLAEGAGLLVFADVLAVVAVVAGASDVLPELAVSMLRPHAAKATTSATAAAILSCCMLCSPRRWTGKF